MTSLIEGWFLPVDERPYIDDTGKKSYLTVFDACASLGSIATGVFMVAELRLYLGGQSIQDKVIHAHGRFCVVSPPGEEPMLLVEVHRFDIMNAPDPVNDKTPDTICTSVTICGRAVLTEVASEGHDKFFTLELNEYIRGGSKTFNIRFSRFEFYLYTVTDY